MEFEDIIGYALRVGVITSAGFIIIGLALFFIGKHPTYIANELLRYNSSTINVYKIPIGIKALDLTYFIYFGLIILIATPVIRVILGVIQFIDQKNRIYVAITLVVLFNLMMAIFVLPRLITDIIVIFGFI
ncbi:MAG: DUF1634 domain-containing protein [Nitrososphaerota archaeon]|jgi:uncharacterized membrane protein|nr:DUF1634 domain-containing protein [Nitrososphaerota archaeon]MDG6926851.1 DUF1634 domain-containing protein [Nitrososphaerota archaeon]MDG6930031.1 DUF1634 domain-containing protein [Nitrososphaerota archaeon]MDG6931982.1 DUF1634 domain-containing protein [Nitrososphaerota archaeon]MDG6943815.1 DUF1634 domain-containing protein [Nitrososphaerota archaeon]